MHHPEVALYLGFHMVLGHLTEAGVGGKVVADGVLPALIVIPEEGERCLAQGMIWASFSPRMEGYTLNYQGDHGQ